MGLLDSLLSGGSGGGLLDFLRSNALNQQFGSGLPSDQAQYGAAPSNAYAQIQPPQQPPSVIQAQPAPQMQAPQPMQQPQQMQRPQGPGFGDRLMAGFQGFAAPSAGGLFGHLAGGIAGLSGQGNLTEQALLARNVDPAAVAASRNDPELRKTLITQTFGPQTVQSLGQGYVADKNGKITRAYTPEQNDNFVVVQTGEDGLGRKTFAKMNRATGEQTPIASPQGDNGGGLGDISKSGPEYLATLPKAVQGTVSGMLDGTIQPPSSFAAAKPYWQGMIAAAKNVDPGFDENKWASRHKLSVDIGASGNSTMGGILSNGKSAFKHLAEYTDSAADLGNTSHNFPLGGVIAHGQNFVGNSLGGSDVQGKIKAINDNLGHYGQESTKFYAASGGGVEERTNARKEMNPLTNSGEEMAAFAEKEKNLMLDRFKEKEAHIRDVMGEDYLRQHPVFTPELQKDIARIDANVAKLRGITIKPAGNQTQTGVSWSIVK